MDTKEAVVDKLGSKIEKTALFTDHMKVKLLSKLTDLTEENMALLERTIDTFDARFAELTAKLQQDIENQIDVLSDEMPEDEKEELEEAEALVRNGVAMVSGVQ